MEISETLLFASAELRVRHLAVAGGDRAVLFVTFDSYTDRIGLDRPGFGEQYFAPRGIDAVHVVSRANDWYQYAELPAALAAIATVAGGYGQVVAYGSSMGGYAALAFGGRCGADAAIALSPQFSLDPRVVPFERRWLADARRIRFRRAPVAPIARQYVLYDPRDPADQRHFGLIAARSPTIGVAIPYSGHPVGSYLAETGSFDILFAGVRDGTLDGVAFARELRARRRLSAHYLYTLALRTPAWRPRTRLALARLAVAARSDDPTYESYLGLLLDRAGRRAEALAAHLGAVGRVSASFHTFHNLLLHYELHGDAAGIAATVARIGREWPEQPAFRQTLRRLRRAAPPATAGERLARALRLDLLADRLLRRD